MPLAARFTVAEVAEALRLHRDTVLKAAEAGDLHGTQRVARGKWSFLEACVDAWAEKRACDHQAANVTPITQRRTA